MKRSNNTPSARTFSAASRLFGCAALLAAVACDPQDEPNSVPDAPEGAELKVAPEMHLVGPIELVQVPADYSALGELMLTAMLIGLLAPLAAVAVIRLARLRSA